MNIVDYLNNLNKDKIDKFIAATSSDITVKRESDIKVSDTSWIDMIEDSINYLDNIIRNPRRFIVQEENIVPIEKAKVVTEESIRHLAQHTSLIQEVQDDGTVIPLKLLNVYREETVDLYENRFIKSLVDNLYKFVDDKLKESDQKSYAKISNVVNYQAVMKASNEEIKVTLNLESKLNRNTDTSRDGHSLEERIEHIKDVIAAFRSSTFIKSLKDAAPVRSPIRKTNVILKEPNFQKALELWEYLEQNAIKPVTSIEHKTEEIKDADIKQKYDLAFFIDSNAIDNEEKVEVVTKYDSSIVSKLVNDFVLSGDATEADFKRLVNKEFREAKKRKEKVLAGVRAAFDKYLLDYDKKKKKAYALLK